MSRTGRGKSKARACHKARPGIEALERRALLSVTAQALAGPLDVAGNTWTYVIDGSSGSLTYTVKGPTTINGQSAIEEDLTTSTGATGKNFYAFTPQGFVYYEQDLTAKSGTTQTTSYSPSKGVSPATLTAGVPFTNPTWTQTDTVTPPGGSPSTDTSTASSGGTLLSETPNVTVQTPAGTFTCWEVDGSQTTTPSDGISPPTTDATKSYFAPNIGLVKLVDTTSGSTTELSTDSVVSTHLEVVQSPTDAMAGEPFNPVFQVAIKDSTGATDTKAEDAVTITPSIGSGSTGTGQLSSTAGAATSGGVASFSGLSINKPGSYVLTFTDTLGRSVPASVKVAAGTLRFKKPIRNGIADSALSPPVEVELVDSKGKLVTDASSLVTLTPTGANAANPISGNSVQLVNGIATFPSLKLSQPADYTLNPTDDEGDLGAPSNQFEITGVHMAFKLEPANTGSGAALRYKVVLEDSKNRLVTNNSLGVGLSLNTISGGQNAVLAHPADVFAFGVADNSAGEPASIDAAGTYTITFTVINNSAFDYAIDPITTKAFDVVANQLVFVKSGGKALPNVPLNYKVEMQDYKHKLVSTATDALTFTLTPIGGATGVLSGGTDTLLGGIADNQTTVPLSINAAGEYTLTVTDVPAAGEPTALSGKSKVYKLLAPK